MRWFVQKTWLGACPVCRLYEDCHLSIIRGVMITSHGQRLNWGFVLSAAVWRQGTREAYLLFTWLLSLDICATVVIGKQILSDRAWRVQQPRFTGGMLFLCPRRCSHCQCGDSMAIAHSSLKSSAAPFSRTWTSSTYCGSRTLISEPSARCSTTTTVRKSMSCRGSWSCRKRRGCICSRSRRRPCWLSYSSTRKRESTCPARHLVSRCSQSSRLLRFHRYVYMAIITHVRGGALPLLLIGCGYVVARLPSHSL